MSEEKWTPGPWAVNPEGPRYCINKNDKQVRHIAMASCYAKTEADEKENEANAHLIAAAPDLYIALCGAVACMEMEMYFGHNIDSFYYMQAIAALKKARGES